jgi:hypothetical protein
MGAPSPPSPPAAASAAAAFRRPPSADPTPHLRVAREGKPRDFDDCETEAVRTAVAGCGPVEMIRAGSMLFFSFSDAQCAAKAAADLRLASGQAPAAGGAGGGCGGPGSGASPRAPPPLLPPLDLRFCLRQEEKVRGVLTMQAIGPASNGAAPRAAARRSPPGQAQPGQPQSRAPTHRLHPPLPRTLGSARPTL